ELYDFRTVIECEAVRRLCALPPLACAEMLAALKRFWIDDPRLEEGIAVSAQDEAFHMALVAAAGNREIARVHGELTEKIRIIRRLDFTRDDRVEATYREHAQILRAIFQQKTEEAQHILTDHIAVSKAEVRKITLHMLQQARLQVTE
ncbi:GntR family transcriptional regulator, partial [Pantoea septica]